MGSTASSMKSICGWKTTVRIHTRYAPIAAAVVAFYETGESITRSLPNSFSMSWRLVPAYQGLQTPCPMMKTRGSLASNCAKPSRMACAYVSVRMCLALLQMENMYEQLIGARIGRVACEPDGIFYLRARFRFDLR